MMAKEKQFLQALVAIPGWELFKNMVFKDRITGQKSLENQLKDKVMASVREGNWEKAAYYNGQVDILSVVFSLPDKELEK